MAAHPGTALPPPMSADAADLPSAVAAALADPEPGGTRRVDAAGISWAAVEWGDLAARPLLLVHGVTSSAATWWRVGPALAAAGFRVTAVDQPGHGETRSWLGHDRFRDNAADLTAFASAAGLAQPGLEVVGHSWGAMTVAALPAVGLVPARLVLLDPPAIPSDVIATILDDPVERSYDDLDEATAAIRAANPTWVDGDVLAKAAGLTAFDEPAVRAVLLGNDWDAGLSDLAHPAARDVPVWVIRGEPETGSYIPADAVAAIASRVGAAHVLTIARGPHSPQRTHPEATVLALLTALQTPG